MSAHQHDHPDHSHSHSHSHGSGKVLLFALIFTGAFAIVEAVAGVLANSLALLSDAGHMLTDSLSLAVGAVAAWLASRPASQRHSFGLQRAEVLGALINVIFMFVVVAFIAWEAVERLFDTPEVDGGAVLLVGGVGLLVNVIVAWVLMRGEQNMNVRGALLHVMGDLLGSVAAIAAGLIIFLGGPSIMDPLLSLLVCVLILVSAVRLLKAVTRVLMEGVPAGIELAEVRLALADIEGVQAVHDLHIWSLSSSNYALAAHVDIDLLARWPGILPQIQQLLRERFGITHSTLQPEDRVLGARCELGAECAAR